MLHRRFTAIRRFFLPTLPTILLTFFWCCSVLHVSAAPPAPLIGAAGGPVSFEPNSNLVILQEQGYSKNPVPFALDTALPQTTVDPVLSGGKYSAKSAPRHLSLASLAPVLGMRIYGIYGDDIISRLVWTIDYQKNTVSVSDPSSFSYSGGGTSLPLTIQNGIPLISIELMQPGKAPVTAKLKVDTGSSDAILVSGSLLQAAKLIPPAQAEIEEQGMGMAGKTVRFITRVSSAKIGPYTLKSPIIVHSVVSSTGPGVGDGSIGGDVLRRFTVVLDFPHKRMILKPNDAIFEPFRYDASGMFLIAQGPDLHQFRVYSVRKGSPAGHAGVAVGDVITAIDGKSTLQITLDQARQSLMRSGDICTLTVQRAGKSLTIPVPLHTLI